MKRKLRFQREAQRPRGHIPLRVIVRDWSPRVPGKVPHETCERVYGTDAFDLDVMRRLIFLETPEGEDRQRLNIRNWWTQVPHRYKELAAYGAQNVGRQYVGVPGDGDALYRYVRDLNEWIAYHVDPIAEEART